MPDDSHIRAERVPAEKLSDAEIERLMALGKLEAALIDEMEAAARAGDKNLVWQIAESLVRVRSANGA
jgi:hypothetical protein